MFCSGCANTFISVLTGPHLVDVCLEVLLWVEPCCFHVHLVQRMHDLREGKQDPCPFQMSWLMWALLCRSLLAGSQHVPQSLGIVTQGAHMRS